MDKVRKFPKSILLFLKIVATTICLIFIIEHYFLEISPFTASPEYILSLLTLFFFNWQTKAFQKMGYFKPSHIPLVALLLFVAVHFRTGFVWALNTFPLKDANTVLLTLQEPFDDFAYSMVRQYLAATIPQTITITLALTVFLYVVLNSTKKRLVPVGIYFVATIVLAFHYIPEGRYRLVAVEDKNKNLVVDSTEAVAEKAVPSFRTDQARTVPLPRAMYSLKRAKVLP